MADSTKRSTLEEMFSAGKIPTESHFAALIASGINTVNDGLKKKANSPLEIQAPVGSAEQGAAKDLILLYSDFEKGQPDWSIRLRQGNLEIGRGSETGLSIDEKGKVSMGKLFLHEHETKNESRIRRNNDDGLLHIMSGTDDESAGIVMTAKGRDHNPNRIVFRMNKEKVLFIEKDGNVYLKEALKDTDGRTLRDPNGGWVRTYGDSGWINETHGGGWHMTNDYIRSYGNKAVYINKKLRADEGFEVAPRGVTSFKIDADGRVGIGGVPDSDKTKKLTIQADGGVYLNLISKDKKKEILIGVDGNGGIVSAMKDHNLQLRTNNNTKVTIKTDGNVGIGEKNPTKAKLVVEGAVEPGDYNLRGYLDKSGSVGDWRKASKIVGLSEKWSKSEASIWASNEIIAGGEGFRIHSDRRIKRVLPASGTAESLAFVNKLQPADYQFVDEIAHGRAVKSGFIAQEVEQLNPHFVKRSRCFIPSIYSLASEVEYDERAETLRLALAAPHHCSPGDKVRIFTEKEKLELTVRETPSEREMVLEGCKKKVEKVFVFGKEVDDFLTLDYNGIFTKGIGAIQELHKQLQQLEQKLERLEHSIKPPQQIQ